MPMVNKNEFSFLYPAPKSIRMQTGMLDIQNLCFPLEISKKYDFLLNYFAVKNTNRGLEITCQEKKTLAAEEYGIECEPGRVVVRANSPRGQFYALSTLLQILAYYQPGGRMPGFSITDAPAISFRGFFLDVAHGAFPLPAEMQRLLLRLAMLKFNSVSLYLGDGSREEKNTRNDLSKGSMTRDEIARVVVLAGRMGMDIFPAIGVHPVAPGHSELEAGLWSAFDAKLIQIRLGEKTDDESAAAWFERFMDTYRFFKARGQRLLVWGNDFLKTPDWIRKIPQDILVLSGDDEIESCDGFRRKTALFKKHHLPQVLGSSTWSQARFIPAMRKSAGNNAAAFAAVQEEKLAGIMLGCRTDQGDGSFLEGIILPLFGAGNLFWSGQAPRPEAFSQWALGFQDPDLFRVYTFLSQVDAPLQHSHWQYLFEDPLFAEYSRQDDVKEITARYQKAALYLKKRKITGNELSDFLNIAQPLYEFVAAKVEFSSRLLSRLNSADGEERIHQDLARLLPGSEKLKNLYCELWLKRRQPYGLARKIREFDFLQERYRHLQQSMARPAARKKLLAEIETVSLVDVPSASMT